MQLLYLSKANKNVVGNEVIEGTDHQDHIDRLLRGFE